MQEVPLDVAQDGNLFPREELLDAVAEADWRERRVPLAALASLSLGLALLTLATPEPLPTDAAAVLATAKGAPALHAPHQLAWVFAKLGLGVERAWYLVSALGLCLSLPLLFLVARTLRVGAGLALGAAAVAVLATAGLGQRPDADAWAVAGAAVVVAALAWRDEASAHELARRAIAALFVGTWLHPASAALAPIVVIALFEAHERDLRRSAPACVVALAAGALGLVSNALRGGGLEGPSHWLRPDYIGSLIVPLAAAATFGALLIVLAGIFELFRTPEEDSEERAPFWMRAGFVVFMGLSFLFDFPGAIVLPLGVLGIVGRINRLADAGSWGRWLVLAIAVAGIGRATTPWWPGPRSIQVVEAAREMNSPISLNHSQVDAHELRYVIRFRYGMDPNRLLVR